MKILPSNSDSIKIAVEILKKGGVIAHPTDTCFGLAGDLMNPEVVKKIQAIKQRDPHEPMSVMISVPEQLRMKDYVALDEFSEFVVYKLFPSPITLVLPKGPKIPKWYFPDNPNIGLRVPMHNLTQDLLMAFGGPLITTSANISSNNLCFNCNEVIYEFKNQTHKPDLCLEGISEKHDMASTVAKVEKDHLKILRKGPMTATQLEGILGVPVK